MIRITTRDFIDFGVLLMNKKDADLLDFWVDMLSEPISVNFLDDEWHDVDTTGTNMLELEALLYQRGMLK